MVAGLVGAFGRRQFERLAPVPGIEFPPPRLDLEALRLEPAEVLRLLEDRPVTAGENLGRVDLSLFRYDGHLAWRVLQEVPGVGVPTLYVHAGDGRVLL